MDSFFSLGFHWCLFLLSSPWPQLILSRFLLLITLLAKAWHAGHWTSSFLFLDPPTQPITSLYVTSTYLNTGKSCLFGAKTQRFSDVAELHLRDCVPSLAATLSLHLWVSMSLSLLLVEICTVFSIHRIVKFTYDQKGKVRKKLLFLKLCSSETAYLCFMPLYLLSWPL